MRIVIPLEIPSQNETERGRNPFARAAATRKRRQSWGLLAMHAMAREGVPKATGKRSLRVVAYRTRLCHDIANLIGGAKACIDGLVDAGLLLDDRDSRAHITYDQKLAKDSPMGRGMICVVIDIEEMP